MRKVTFQMGTVISFFHLRDDLVNGTVKEGKLATFTLPQNVSLIMPSDEELEKLPKFVREFSQKGFIVATCGFECWIVNPKINPEILFD